MVKIYIFFLRVNCPDGLCGTFFTFSLYLLEITGLLPMVCHFVTRIVPDIYSGTIRVTKCQTIESIPAISKLTASTQGTIRVTK
ncbi:hypothetical protein Hanom_Chr13g01213361 [Helianthus anomalus]